MDLCFPLLNCLTGECRWLELSSGIWRKITEEILAHVKKFSFGFGPSPGCDCVMLCWIKDIVLLLPDQTASQKPLFSWCLPSLRHLWCWCFRWADNPQSQQKLASHYLKKKSQNRWLLYVWQYSTLLKKFNSLLFIYFFKLFELCVGFIQKHSFNLSRWKLWMHF